MMDFLLGLVDNYWGIFLLMSIESSFVPFPSEVVIPPAAYLAAQGELNVFVVVLFGVLGSLIGALINYFLAMFLGRPLVYILVEKKWARMFLLSKAKVEKAERYFLRRGGISTFIGRLLPAIRQLISLPAGFTRMNLGKFVGFTVLGSGIWVSILAVIGYYFNSKQDLFFLYYKQIGYSFVGIVFFVFIYFLLRKTSR